jgi:hypothetical protein
MIEVDGYLLDRFKAFYSRLYGTLTFAADHGRQSNCEGAGHGDSAVYPGGSPETGVQRPVGTSQRLNQEITLCDLHHNMAGWSGTNGNAVHTHRNNIYDNAIGIQTDVVTGAGHPGYPGDSAVVEHNNIYSNNFNPYDPSSDVKPAFPFPVGTGMWIAGGNHHTIRENHFYDNWRRGTMIFSVPDSLVCGPVRDGNEQAGCNAGKFSTSHYNQTYDNFMGIRPDGSTDLNGTDFWWDGFAGSRGNCWFRNQAPQGRGITTDPPGGVPNCDDGKDPAASLGTGDPENESELGSCVLAFETRNFDPNGPCPWVRTPPEPGNERARASTATASWADRPAPVVKRYVDPNKARVPLGQATCSDWRRAPAAARAPLVARLRSFAGGVVNDGQQDIGTGRVMTLEESQRHFDAWCGRAYAQGFLLYKLYSAGAVFTHRDRAP